MSNKGLPSLPKRSAKVPFILASGIPQARPPPATQHVTTHNQHATADNQRIIPANQHITPANQHITPLAHKAAHLTIDRETLELREEVDRLNRVLEDKNRTIVTLQKAVIQKQNAIDEADRREALLLRNFRAALETHQSLRSEVDERLSVTSSSTAQDGCAIFVDSDSDYF